MLNILKNIFKIHDNHEYDLDSLSGINQIALPKYKPIQGMGNPSNNI